MLLNLDSFGIVLDCLLVVTFTVFLVAQILSKVNIRGVKYFEGVGVI